MANTIEGLGAIVKNLPEHASVAVRAGLKYYEKAHPIVQASIDLGVASAVQKGVTEFELRHRMRIGEHTALAEIRDEVAAVTDNYTQHLSESYHNLGSVGDDISNHFSDNPDFKATIKALDGRTVPSNKMVLDSEALIGLANKIFDVRVREKINSLSETLAETSHAEKYMSPTHAALSFADKAKTADVSRVLGSQLGVELLGKELGLPTAIRLGGHVVRGAQEGIYQASRQATRQIKESTARVLTRQLAEVGKLNIGDGSYEKELQELMVRLERNKIIKKSEGSRRGNPVFDTSTREAVLAAVEVIAMYQASANIDLADANSELDQNLQLARKVDLMIFLSDTNKTITSASSQASSK